MKNVKNILSRLEYFANNTPDKICLIEALTGKKVSYENFWLCILRYAKGVKSKERYILRTRQTIAHLVAYYGVQAAGSVAIPIDASMPDEKVIELSKRFNANILPVDYELGLEELNYIPLDSESVSCVILTNGTTGKSKGVMSSYRCRFCGADNVRCSYEITSEDVALIPQALSHSGGLRRVEAMLISGATAVIMKPTMFFGNVFSAIRKYNCTILQFVPAQVSQILSRAEKMLLSVSNQIRILSVGSAVITESDKEKLRELLPKVRLFNDYGSTEAIGSSYFEWSAFPAKPNCIGKPGLHSNIVFLDENGSVMKSSSYANPGLIATEGGTLMSGYLDEPELTNDVMKDGRILSSDLGYIGEDGYVYILGRKDDMIVSGGYKISPLEIENVVSMIPGVKECACVPKEDRIMGHVPALYVVWEHEIFSVDKLIKIMENNLEKYKLPLSENIYVVDSLPKSNNTGKVIKRLL